MSEITPTAASPYNAGCLWIPAPERSSCLPVEIEIQGFRPVWNEVIFLDMSPEDDDAFEPLVGYVILEQAQAAVDMLGHRLVPVRYMDLKAVG